MQLIFNANMETLGERLKFARKARGMTQDQVAAISGVEQSDISKIENGRTSRPTELYELARAVRCSPEWLSRREGGWDSYDWEANTRATPKTSTRWRKIANNLARQLEGHRVDPAAFLGLVDLMDRAIPEMADDAEVESTVKQHLRLVA